MSNSKTIFFFLLFSSVASAEGITVIEKVSLSFEPRSVQLLEWGSNQGLKIHTAIYSKGDSSQEERTPSAAQEWYLAAPIEQVASTSKFTFLIKGETQTNITSEKDGHSVIQINDPKKLSESTVVLSKETWQLQNEFRSIEKKLRELKQDIGVVGNLERIVRIRDEQKKYEGMLQSMNQEEITLRNSIATFKAGAKPTQYSRREHELLQAISALNVKTIPYRQQLARAERARRIQGKELRSLEKRVTQKEVARLEKKLAEYKASAQNRPF